MISVIVPVFNAGRKLQKLFQTLKNQTLNDLEIIIVNDGSTDETDYICAEAEKTDPRIRCIKQRNKGTSKARNLGLQIANGEYIAFLDADDQINENYFEELYRNIKTSDIVLCDVCVEDRYGKEIFRFSAESLVMDSTIALNLLLTRTKINSGPCGKLFRKDIIKGIKFPTMKVYEDILYLKDAFSNAGKIASTNQTTYHYIQNENSVMHTLEARSLDDIVTATDILADFIIKKPQLDARCFYITLSHLYQYVIEYGQNNPSFVNACRNIYWKYYRQLVHCSIYTWKEKALYSLFMIGFKTYEEK